MKDLKNTVKITPEFVEAKMREARRLRAETFAKAFDFGLKARLKALFARSKEAGAKKAGGRAATV